MRRTHIFGLFGLGLLGVLAPSVSSCGTDPDTPTPSRKTYPADAIDQVPVTSSIKLPELSEAVRVVRDKRGMVHVYARNVKDMAIAEGYMMARDRAPQLELIRRVAEGRLAELFGNLKPSLVDQDITMRTMGLRRAGKQYWDSLTDPNARAILEGFSAGITHYFRELRCLDSKHDPALVCPDTKVTPPLDWGAIKPSKYLDWDPVATLAIARLQTWALSYTADDELDFTDLYTKAHDTFKAGDPRAGFLVDAARFEPGAKRPVLDFGVPPATSPMNWNPKPKGPLPAPPRISNDLLARTRPFQDAIRATRDFMGKGGWSSNNWVVSPQKSATGQTLVASDPHLGLPAPSIFYMAGLHVISDDPAQQLDVAGMSFAGIPGVVLGFNKNIAWGATVAVFDVNDVYRDKVVGDKVTIKGAPVDIVKIEETIDYGDGNPVPLTIESIPGHGNVFPTLQDHRFVPRTGDGEVLAVRWTGMEPSGEFEAFMNLNRAKNVDDAYAALQKFEVGAQNFVIGDSSGNIRYTTHSKVPTRPKGALTFDSKTMTGQVPCLVIPGDAGLEWDGRVPVEQLPGVKNPAWGYVGTANSDQYGLSFDNDVTNDAIFLSCTWDPGFREFRVRERLDAIPKLTLDDLASIQADTKSPLGSRMTKYLVSVLARAEAARLGTTPAPDLDALIKDKRYDGARMAFVLNALRQWDSLGYDTPAAFAIEKDPLPSNDEIAASQATLIFNSTLVPLMKNVFDDEIAAMGNPPMMRDFKVKALLRMLDKPEALATAGADGESILWDDLGTTDTLETKDQQLLRAMLEGVDHIVTTLGADPDKWRWGAVHGVTFTSLLPGSEAQLSIPNASRGLPSIGFPRHGDWQNIDRSDPGLGSFDFTYSSGPAQRFVANLDPKGPVVKNALPGGNVWDPSSPHFDDEAELWRRNKNAPIAFAPGEVVPVAEDRYDLVPF
ncbi:MAG: penicillin acylase family protein [Polyangiales bacterium]